MKNNKIIKFIIFIAVLIIPIMYSFFYLKSYWNPYGDLTGMKIAVVNLDKGENEENQGIEFIQGLKESGTFDICDVTIDEANEGMQNGNYYATITVPSNFTECLNSASTTDKQIATITYSPNQASNYLATQIINSAVKTIELNLEEKINSKIVEKLADNIEVVPDSLEEIFDGTNQILDGSKNLNSGLEQINDGTSTLNSIYNEFDDGVVAAYDGSKSVENGLTQVNTGINSLSIGANSLDIALAQINEGINTLDTQGTAGISQLTSGFKQLASGAEQVSNGINGIAAGLNTQISANQTNILEQANVNSVTQLDGLISNYNSKIIPLATVIGNGNGAVVDPNNANGLTYQQEYDAIISGLSSLNQAKGSYNALEGVKVSIIASSTSGDLYALKEGAKQVSFGASQLNSQETIQSLTNLTDGIKNLKVALIQVKEGMTSLNGGISTLSAGGKTLKTGSISLCNGLEKLNSSSKEVKNALETLSNGTNTAYEGSKDLVNGIQIFKNEINNGLQDTKEQLESLDGIEKFAENPVEFKTEAYGKVDSYGIAFTPLFLCIGLWVGALMAYVVLYYDQQNRFEKLGSSSKNKILQNVLYIIIGAVQGIITAGLLKAGLGFEVENMKLYYVASTLIGITFMGIIQFLIRNFGDVGKFIALIILVLQLAASGGTFPVETINKGFQALTPYLPMTYSINLVREILVPTNTNFKGKYMAILLGVTIVTILLTYIVDIFKNRKQK